MNKIKGVWSEDSGEFLSKNDVHKRIEDNINEISNNIIELIGIKTEYVDDVSEFLLQKDDKKKKWLFEII